MYQQLFLAKFLALFYISCPVNLLVQVSYQYHHGFWSCDNFFYKWLTRIPEIGSTIVWVLLNICRQGCLGILNLTELGISNLTRISQIKCYWMLQNARVTAFTVSELLRESQQGLNRPPLLTQNRVKIVRTFNLSSNVS